MRVSQREMMSQTATRRRSSIDTLSDRVLVLETKTKEAVEDRDWMKREHIRSATMIEGWLTQVWWIATGAAALAAVELVALLVWAIG